MHRTYRAIRLFLKLFVRFLGHLGFVSYVQCSARGAVFCDTLCLCQGFCDSKDRWTQRDRASHVRAARAALGERGVV